MRRIVGLLEKPKYWLSVACPFLRVNLVSVIFYINLVSVIFYTSVRAILALCVNLVVAAAPLWREPQR